MTSSGDTWSNHTVSLFLLKLLGMFICISFRNQFVFKDFFLSVKCVHIYLNKKEEKKESDIMVYSLFIGLRKLIQDQRFKASFDQ